MIKRYAITDATGAVVVVHSGTDRTATEMAKAEGGAFIETEIEDLTGYRFDGNRLRAPTAAQVRRRADQDAERKARAKRDARLAATDWTQIPDAPVNRAAWAAYRRALRDLTDQPGFPHDIEWPTEPGEKE